MCFTPTSGPTGAGAPMSARPESAAPEPRAIFLRGVNVGGANRLPMAEWRDVLAGQGFGRPETYIQSGNAVVDATGAAGDIALAVREGIATRFGFAPAVFVLSGQELDAALRHPFGVADPARVHAVLLAEVAPAIDRDRIEALRAPSETVVLRPGLILLHAPDGIGRSKLAEALPRLVRCPVSARNLNTMAAVLAMLRSRRREDGAG